MAFRKETKQMYINTFRKLGEIKKPLYKGEVLDFLKKHAKSNAAFYYLVKALPTAFTKHEDDKLSLNPAISMNKLVSTIETEQEKYVKEYTDRKKAAKEAEKEIARQRRRDYLAKSGRVKQPGVGRGNYDRSKIIHPRKIESVPQQSVTAMASVTAQPTKMQTVEAELIRQYRAEIGAVRLELELANNTIQYLRNKVIG